MRFTITVELGGSVTTTTLPNAMAKRIEAIAKATGRGVHSIIVDAIDTDTRDLAGRLNHQGPIARMTQGWRDHMLATHRRQVAIAKRREAETEDRVNAKLQAVADGIRGARG